MTTNTNPTAGWTLCDSETCDHDMHQTVDGIREGWVDDPAADGADNILARQDAWRAVANGSQLIR